jgi:GrpB-like predicted nucleotidyltransferase (UPF0157 family)
MNSRLASLEKSGLGLARDGTVVLKANNSLWEKAAQIEIDLLSKNIHNPRISFHHIGSTSIAGLFAKPILDLLILAPSLAEIDLQKGVFEDLGYEYKGEYGIPGRRYCVLYNEERTKVYVHIHAFQSDNAEADHHLLFRDYLRAVPEIAKQYQKLKLDLIADENINRSNYTETKAPFIKSVLLKAQEWRKSL